MKVDYTFEELADIIADYDTDIWNNPNTWTKKEWHLFDLFLYYCGLNWFKRRKSKRLLKKKIKEKKHE